MVQYKEEAERQSNMGKKKNKNVNESESNIGYEVINNNNEEVHAVSNGRGDYPVQYPEQINRDYIAVMDDEMLHNLGRSLADSIHRVGRFNLNPYPWEVEMCYVQQEVQLRMTRRATHSAWLNKNSTTMETN